MSERAFTIAPGALTTKKMIADVNPNRKSIFIFNNTGLATASGCLIYLGDSAWPVFNIQSQGTFSICKADDNFTGRIFGYDSAGLATLYVTEISE